MGDESLTADLAKTNFASQSIDQALTGAATTAMQLASKGSRSGINQHGSLLVMSMNFFWTSTISRAKRLIRMVFGITILIVGVCMIVLPGPAVVVIPVGLMILATEFVWARKLMERFEKQVKALKNGKGGDATT